MVFGRGSFAAGNHAEGGYVVLVETICRTTNSSNHWRGH